MSDYLKHLCLGLAVLLLSCTYAAGQSSLGPEGVRERDPVLNAAGDLLFFTRPDYTWNQGTEDRADIWMRYRDGRGGWKKAINPGAPINSFGDDRMLGISVDGNRMAVLRRGATGKIDLLERSGRNWRVRESWPLPPDIRDLDNLAFNVNSLLLVYAHVPPRGGLGDLYHRYVGADGRWSPAAPLRGVNAAEEETAPQFAGDGRTLLFRRAGAWYRQLDRDLPAEKINLSARYLQVAAGGTAVVGTTDDTGRDEHTVPVATRTPVLPPSELRTASLGESPAPGERTVSVPLSSDVVLWVYPDLLDRYAVMLRPGEVDFPDSSVPSVDRHRSVGSLASAHSLPVTDRRSYLRQRIETQEAELARLDSLRRQYGFTHLPDGAGAFNGPLQDTEPDILPTDSTDATRQRYVRQLNELARRKEAFRRQREDRSGELDPAGGSGDGDIARLDGDYLRQLEELRVLRRQLHEAIMADEGTEGRDRSLAGRDMTPKSGTLPPADDPAHPTFVPNTAYLDNQGYEAINRLADRIRRATRVVDIRVHVSGTLSSRAARRLSEERASAITEQLIELGVAADSFTAIGYGNREPEGGERVEVMD